MSARIPGQHHPDPQVVPYLLYADADAAMDWLIKAFGFTERVRDTRSDGTVRHGELLLGNGGVIMLGSPAHRDRAQAAGANVSEIGIRANRARSYTVDDPEGHRWYFSEPL